MKRQLNDDLKTLFTRSLRESQHSYAISQLFEHFPTITELLDVTEQQLNS
jgi:DNA repair protein RadC